MSWIFGAFGFLDIYVKDRLKKIIQRHLLTQSDQTVFFQADAKNFCLLAGGNNNTLQYGKIDHFEHNQSKNFDNEILSSDETYWVSVGLGILYDSGFYRFMRDKDWIDFLINEKNKTEDLNGHFCSVVVSNDEIKIFTDQLGTRDIYFIKKENFFVFSTNLDLLTKYLGKPEIDFREIGSLWLLESQINTGSFIKNILRLTSSAKIFARLNNKFEFAFDKKAWTPQKYDNVSEEQIYEKLKELILMPINENSRILLALSGGMDSRMLLSMLMELLESKTVLSDLIDSSFEAFTFGLPDDLDVEIPSILSRKFGFKHNIYFDDIIFDENTLSQLTKFILDTRLTFPASEFLLKRNYKFLENEKAIIIDGCWGEITRSSLFKRIIYFAPNEIKKRNPKIFYQYMQYPHADIFNDEINRMMFEGALEHLENTLNSMPDINYYSLENWMDLFAVRTKQPNLVGIEQTRIDNLVRSYSPFVQPDFFNLIFGADPKIKRKGKLIKEIFQKNKNRLDKYPLNAGGVKIPFSYSSFSISIKKKLFSKFKRNSFSYRNILFEQNNNFLYDLINSFSFTNFDFYDKKKIKKIHSDFSKGNPKAIKELDWLLAFELFRKGLSDE